MEPTQDDILDLLRKSSSVSVLQIAANYALNKIEQIENENNSPSSDDKTDDDNRNLIVNPKDFSRLKSSTLAFDGGEEAPYPQLDRQYVDMEVLSNDASRNFMQFLIINNDGAINFKMLENSLIHWGAVSKTKIQVKARTLRTWVSRWAQAEYISYVPEARGLYSMTQCEYDRITGPNGANPYVKKTSA